MSNTRLFAIVGVVALACGAAFWHLMRPATSPAPQPAPVVAISPAATYAATFDDGTGGRQALGQFQGKVVVLNFWATWCEPCRAEMPAFNRLHERWAGRGVQFVGLSDEAPEVAARFGRQLGITYPLWTGGDQVSDLSRRLGNAIGGLPHTVILDPTGAPIAQKVGPYKEDELEALLKHAAPNAG